MAWIRAAEPEFWDFVAADWILGCVTCRLIWSGTKKRANMPITLSDHPRTSLVHGATPLHRLPRLSEKLGIDLWIKRDNLAGAPFGGNKSRQLEYYLGHALDPQINAQFFR